MRLRLDQSLVPLRFSSRALDAALPLSVRRQALAQMRRASFCRSAASAPRIFTTQSWPTMPSFLLRAEQGLWRNAASVFNLPHLLQTNPLSVVHPWGDEASVPRHAV